MVLRALVTGPMTEAKALQTVASIAAETVGASEQLDTGWSAANMERGKQADLIFIDGNPPAGIDELVNVDAVMKGGHFVTQEEILAPSPKPSVKGEQMLIRK